MEIYKVRNKEGLYWNGIKKGGFSNIGDEWSLLGNLQKAIKYVSDKDYDSNIFPRPLILPDYLNNCQIVKFELKEIETLNIE